MRRRKVCPPQSGTATFDLNRSLFGGCNRLLLQYRTIGTALKVFERGAIAFGFRRANQRAERELILSLAYVPVEVLESFREDLLDLDLGVERLFIEQPGVQLSFAHLAIIALSFCVLGGACAVAAGNSPLLSTMVGCVLALVIMTFSLSRHQLSRRMRFANVLNHEINRRRGTSRDGTVGSVKFSLSHSAPVH